jgi:hypothetical protein
VYRTVDIDKRVLIGGYKRIKNKEDPVTELLTLVEMSVDDHS